MSSRVPRALFRLSLAVFATTFLSLAAMAAPCTPGATDRTVTICTPASGATVTSPVEVSAAATDSASVSNMQIYVDGKAVYTSLNTKSIDTSITLATGTHTLTVQAKDGSGLFKSTISVTVSGSGGGGGGSCSGGSTNRTVTICSPTNGSTVTSPVEVTAAATDSATVSNMQIYVDGKAVYTKTGTTSIDTPVTLAAGTHRLTVQAKDSAGYFKSTVNVTVSNSGGGGGTCSGTTNRTITICSPADGSTVDSPVELDAIATDSSAVSYMQVYLDNVKVYEKTNTKSISTTLSTSSGTHRLTVQAKDAGGIYKTTINFTVANSGGGGGSGGTVAVTTWRNDLARSGQNLNETTLTPSNVNATKFGKKFTYAVDGYVFAQPLVVPGVSIGGGTHNVVFVATQHDSVYAFDADGGRTSAYWKKSFIDSANGITTVPGSDVNVSNEWGVTATPVIDRASNTIYLLSRTKNTKNDTYSQKLHALDLSTGAEKFGGPVEIQACVSGSGAGAINGQVCFNSLRENSRVALTLLNGVVYLAWASLDDTTPYHGWVLGYSANSLQRVALFNATPNGSDGGIWMGGGGMSSDGSNLFAITGNGTFNAGNDNYGDTYLKIATSGGTLVLSDYFTPYDQANLSSHDLDLGSTAPLLLTNSTSTHTKELLGAGKNGHAYLVDANDMGKYQSGSNSQIVQELTFPAGVYTTPAYWNGRVYFIGNTDVVKQFNYSNGTLGSSPAAKGSHTYGYPGANPTISANGTSNGILWAVEKTSSGTAVLHAYDATNVAKELYSSATNASRDSAGTAVKFVVPTVANGKVYVGTTSKLVVYGLF